MRTTVYRALGGLFFALGFVGIFLPLMPTVLFWIVAVYFFLKSDPKRAEALFNHEIYGPMLRDWFERGVISKRGKMFACLGIGAGMASSVYFLWGKPIAFWIAMAIFAFAFLFILTRPSS